MAVRSGLIRHLLNCPIRRHAFNNALATEPVESFIEIKVAGAVVRVEGEVEVIASRQCCRRCADDCAAGGTHIWVLMGTTSMRNGMNGLSAFVKIALDRDPHSDQVFILHGRCGDMIKGLWFDGDGLCLFAKLTSMQLFLQ